MFLPPGADDPSYATVSARQCKYGGFSLPVYRKQEKSLFTATLEQTSNVPTAAMSADRPAADAMAGLSVGHKPAGHKPAGTRARHRGVTSPPEMGQKPATMTDIVFVHRLCSDNFLSG